jgi:hypothetical protein
MIPLLPYRRLPKCGRAWLQLVLLPFLLASLCVTAQAGWLSRIAGTADNVGAARAARKGATLDHAAAHLKALPDRPDGIALAAQATQEGHWRFVNKAGETFTAGTADELKRVASVLLPDAKADAKLSLYVTPDTVFQHRAALKQLPKSADLLVVIGDESYRILRRADATSERLFAQVRPSLFIELAERVRFDEALWQLMRPLERARVRVLALEPGGPSTLTSTPRIDAATKRAAVDVIDPASLPAAMGAIRGQTVLVTGRVDGQLLYVKPSSGPEKSLLVRDLLKAADDADVNLVMLQSASTPRQPGGRNWFWQKVEVKGLDNALQHPRMADFFNALAGQGRRFAVTATPSGSLRTGLDMRLAPDLPGTSPGRPASEVFADLVADVAGRVLTDGVQASMRDAERQQELDQRIIPGIPSEAQFLYILLMVMGLLGLPVSRRWWRRLWPPEQAGEYPIRSGYWAARMVRGAMFLLIFLPLTAQPAMVVHFAQSIWQMVMTPVRWWRWLSGRNAPAGAG